MNTPVVGEPVNGVAPTASDMPNYLDVSERLARGDKTIPSTLFIDAIQEGVAFCGDWPIEPDEVCGCLG